MHSRKLEFSLSAFYCTKNTGLNFWKFPVPNETAFRGSLFLQVSFQNSENEDNLAKKNTTFPKFIPRHFCFIQFCSHYFQNFSFFFFFFGGGGGGWGGFGKNFPPLFLDFQNFVV